MYHHADRRRPQDRNDQGRRASAPYDIAPYDTAPYSTAYQSDRSPPRRPPIAPRFNTMDPSRNTNKSRDPRNPLPLPKRGPSRSPEGSARKQPKQNGNASVSSSNGFESRRSSVHNGSPRDADAGARTPQDRRPSAQPNKEPSKEGKVKSVGSPNRGGSLTRNGSTSRGSTPSLKPTAPPTTGDAVPSETDAVMNDAIANESPDTLIDALTLFSAQSAAQASLQLARDQAEAQSNRAQLVYNANYHHFKAYPAVKEKKTAGRDAARKELASRDTKLDIHKAAQTQLIATLATLIGQAAEVQPQKESSVDGTDHVSRDEFNNLLSTCAALQSDINTVTSENRKLRTELAAVKIDADQVSGLSERIATCGRLQQETSESILLEAERLKQSVTKAQSDSAATWRELNKFRDQDAAKFATRKELKDLATKEELKALASKQELADLETSYETMNQDVAGVKKSLQKQLAQLKADKFTSSVAPSSAAKDNDAMNQLQSRVDELYTQAPALISDVEVLKEEVGKLKSEINESNGSRENVDGLKAQMEGEGIAESVSSHLRKLNIAVNNVSTQIHGDVPIVQRVSQAEKDIEALQSDSKKHDANLLALNASGTGSTVTEDSVNKAIETYGEAQNNKHNKQLCEFADEVDEIRTSLMHVRSQIASGDNIQLDQWSKLNDRLNKLNDSQVSAHKTLEGVQRSMDSKLSNQAFLEHQKITQASLVSITKLDDRVKKLESRRDSATATPRGSTSTSTPQNPAQYVPPPGPLPPGPNQSPSLPTSAGSIMQAPPHVDGTVQAPQNQAQMNHVLSNRMDGLVVVFQHLKQRCDNLTTDHIARCMVDQMQQMYPHAKNFNAAVEQIHTQLFGLSGRFDKMQQDLLAMNNKVIWDAGEVAKAVDAVKTHLQSLQTDFDKFKGTAAEKLMIVKNDIDDIKEQLVDHEARIEVIKN